MRTSYKYLFLFIFVLLNACNESVVKVKTEQEANRILLHLRENKIDAKKQLEAAEWIIKVPHTHFTDSLRVLESKRLLEKVVDTQAEDRGVELFATKDQRAKEYLRAISKELATTLGMFPGVVDARIHIYKNPDAAKVSTGSSGTASVVLLADDTYAIEQEAIKLLIAQASGIEKDAVAVIIHSAKTIADEQGTIKKFHNQNQEEATPFISEEKLDSVITDKTSAFSLYYELLNALLPWSKKVLIGIIVFTVVISAFRAIKAYLRKRTESQILNSIKD